MGPNGRWGKHGHPKRGPATAAYKYEFADLLID